MKIVKRLVIWILLAVILETAVFGYMDKFYFVTESNFTAVKVNVNVDQKPAPKLEIKVPDKLEIEYKSSTNGKYLIYKDEDALKVVNTVSGEGDELKPAENESFSYFRWVPDSNRVLIVKKTDGNKKFKLYYYDVNIKGKLTEVRNYMDGSLEGQEVSIPVKHPKAEVDDIDLSTLNGVLYIKVLNNGRQYEIYRMDRMAYMQRVPSNELKALMVGRISSTKRSEKLVYEDIVTGKIYATGVKTPLMPKGVDKAILLGLDSSDDNIYLGALQDGMINKIYFGKAEEPVDTWKVLTLPSPRKKEEIVIYPGGKVYLNNNLEGILLELKTWEQVKYEGRFLQVYDSGLISESQSVLDKLTFKSAAAVKSK